MKRVIGTAGAQSLRSTGIWYLKLLLSGPQCLCIFRGIWKLAAYCVRVTKCAREFKLPRLLIRCPVSVKSRGETSGEKQPSSLWTTLQHYPVFFLSFLCPHRLFRNGLSGAVPMDTECRSLFSVPRVGAKRRLLCRVMSSLRTWWRRHSACFSFGAASNVQI